VTRLGRLWRELRPDRNPLRRACDRAEAALLGGLLGAFLIGVPLAAVFAGLSQYHADRARQASWHQVPAVVLPPVPDPGYAGLRAAVLATWTAPGGAQRTGWIVAPAHTRTGGTVTVWIDGSGRPAHAPVPPGQMAGEAIVVAGIGAAAAGLPLLGTAALARWVLAKRRFAAWDAEWRATGPRWTSQR
jgi:hypothetical protein